MKQLIKEMRVAYREAYRAENQRPLNWTRQKTIDLSINAGMAFTIGFLAIIVKNGM